MTIISRFTGVTGSVIGVGSVFAEVGVEEVMIELQV
jgi:hypothetical protein